MAFKQQKEFNLEIDPELDEVIDETPGSSFIALRRLKWSDMDPYRIDIRKWHTNKDGEEIAGKGVSFMTPEGPGNLIEVLLKHGYGETRQVLSGIKDREDFLPAVKEIIMEKGVDYNSIEVESLDSLDENFYDPKSLF